MQKVFRQWDGVAGISLFLIIFLSAYSLELTYWTYDLNRVTLLALLGLMTGLAVGFSSFSERFSSFLISLYGIALSYLQLVISLDASSSWLERTNHYLLRVSSSTDQLMRSIPLEDGILFLTFAGVLFCFLGLKIGFNFIRLKKSWFGITLIVFFFYLVQFYLPFNQRNYLFIAIYSMLVIVYLGRHFYLTRERTWKSKHIKVEKEASAYFSKLVLIITFSLITISLIIPSAIQLVVDRNVEKNNSQRPWEYSTSWEVLRNFFYPLRQQSGFGEAYLPEILALGNSRSLRDEEVFLVRVPDDFSIPNRYYWKGRAYDFYENGLWQSKDPEIQHLPSIEAFPYAGKTTRIGLFSFIYQTPREIIFTPQIVVSIEHEADLVFFPTSSSHKDVLTIIDNQLIHKDEQVDVVGGFYVPEWRFLLNARENLPDWIQSRYLQLPPEFPEKITSLAYDLSTGKETRIEKALAITDYLRNTFRYKDFVEIPQGKDPIEWFLFEGREGFCNYFASTEVLMLRTIGIPARMVVGYAQGERISEKNEFMVRIKDSHSWVEAFFPDLGWVILEPTPSQPGIILDQLDESSSKLERIESLLLKQEDQFLNPKMEFYSGINEKYQISAHSVGSEVESRKNNGFWWPGLIALSGIILSMVYFIFLRKKPILIPMIIEKEIIKRGKNAPAWLKKWANYEKLPGYQKAYKNLRMLSNILISKVNGNSTPYEYFNNLNKNLIVDNQLVKEFKDSYHRLAFGTLNEQSDDMYFHNYKMLLRLIIKHWGNKKIEWLKIHLRLNII